MATGKHRSDAKIIPMNKISHPVTKVIPNQLKFSFSKDYRILIHTFQNHA